MVTKRDTGDLASENVLLDRVCSKCYEEIAS